MNIDQIIKYEFLHNNVSDYIIALAIFVVGLIVVRIFKTIILGRLKGWAEKTTNKFDDFAVSLIETSLMPLFYFGAFYIAIQSLTLKDMLRSGFNMFTVALLTIVGINFAIRLVDAALQVFWLNKQSSESKRKSLHGILNIA